MITRSAFVFAGCLLLIAWSTAFDGAARQESVGAKAVSPDPLAEYPAWDRRVRDQHRTELATEKADRLLATAPDAFETAQALLAVTSLSYRVQDRNDDALRVARAVFEKHPDDIAKTIETIVYYASNFDTDGARDYRPALRELLGIARRRLPQMAEPQAADLAYQLTRFEPWVNRDRSSSIEPLKAVLQEYPGTEGALRAELAILVRYGASGIPNPDALAKFAADHAGTCAAAEALRMESSRVGNAGVSGRGDADPTERTLRMLAVEEQLNSPAYKACRPTFSRGLPYAFASKPVYAPGNVDRVLTAYRGYLKTHLGPDAGDPMDGVGYLVTSVIRQLFAAKGEGMEALDRYLADLEKDAAVPDAVRYLRALVWEPLSSGNGPSDAPAPPQQTVALLTELEQTRSGLFQRKALATLAWLYGFYGDTAKARECYADYAKRYPESGYAWVAGLRSAECAAASGDWKAAAIGYQATARTYTSMPLARVLGHTYAARAFEAQNDFERAKAEYQAAVDGWVLDYGEEISIATQRRRPLTAAISFEARDPQAVTLSGVASRLTQLRRTTAAPGGVTLEQGRWLADHGKRKEAARLLADFGRRYRGSTNVAEAQYIAHSARLSDALEMLNIEGDTNEAAGMAALEALAHEPYDFAITAAKITRACVLWKQAKQDVATRLMDEALRERLAHQQLREPTTPLERDVAAIRSLLFLPTGGSAYAAARGWNAFSWPAALPAFVIAGADARVKTVDGRTTDIPLYQRFPGLTNVVLVDRDELAFFSNLMNKVGGTKKRAPQAIMETPNQPMGPSVSLIAFLDKFFPARPGHWGGWEFLTYPQITLIEFTDAERTTARAKVTIGYSGCDILLEKANAAWKVVRMVNEWIT